MQNQATGNKRIAQKRRREALMLEGLTGKTVKDTLPNTSYPWVEEAEAMYFKGARDFLRTSLAYNILCGHQDVSDKVKV